MSQGTGGIGRVASVDAYRGFVMLVMASGGLAVSKLVAQWEKAGETFHDAWRTAADQLSHVPWTGCSFWDLIQPSFIFIVGVAMPFSYARRQARGDSYLSSLAHAVVRAVILVLLGVMLASNGKPQTVFVFTNVLAQIGLAYLFVFLLLGRWLLVQWTALVAILAGYWYLFYQHQVPLPGPGFNRAAFDIPDNVPLLSGLAAHWNMNVNYATTFDQWLLNLDWFSRPTPYKFSNGGYQTLNFVPSIATMLMGVMAGQLLLGDRSGASKRNRLLVYGLVLLAVGMVVDHTIWPDRLADLVSPKAAATDAPSSQQPAPPADQQPQPASVQPGSADSGADQPTTDEDEADDQADGQQPAAPPTTEDQPAAAPSAEQPAEGEGSTATALAEAGAAILADLPPLGGFFSRDWTICPIVKRIWTPTWVLFSTGWALVMLAGFYCVIDVWGLRPAALPFVVVGMNSIVIYLMSQLMHPWMAATLKTHLGSGIFDGPYGPLVQSASVLAVFWAICFLLYQKRVFVRI